MSKQVIATVKTDDIRIIEGVNRLKLLPEFGSASEVCVVALQKMICPEPTKFDFHLPSNYENRLRQLCFNLEVNDEFTIEEIARQHGIFKEVLISEIITKFCRGEIQFYEPKTVNVEIITQEIKTEIEEETPEIKTETVQETPENTVIIDLSEIENENIIESLRVNGFEELRYFTAEKEQETNRKLKSQFRDHEHDLRVEIRNLMVQNEQVIQANEQVEGLINGTKLVIEAHLNRNKYSFYNVSKETILKMFLEELRPIFL